MSTQYDGNLIITEYLSFRPQPMVLVPPCLHQVFVINSNNYQQ